MKQEMTTHHHPLELSHQALKSLKIKVMIMVTMKIMAWVKGEHKVKKLKEKHLKLKEMMMVNLFNHNAKCLIQECFKVYNGIIPLTIFLGLSEEG